MLEMVVVVVKASGRGWWKNTDSIPSPLPQLHIVHYDSDSYESLSEAAQRPQGLAVLGILIEVSGPPILPRSVPTPQSYSV